MSPRPISSWVYAGGGPASRWASLQPRFGAPVRSAVELPDALRDARRRWGLSRLASITSGTSWACEEPSGDVGFCYAKLGPDADACVLRSAWELLERGAADAVWVRAREAAFLLERTGDGPVSLHCGKRAQPELTFEADPRAAITAIVVGAAIVELGLRCGPEGVEPERLVVQANPTAWQLEVRP